MGRRPRTSSAARRTDTRKEPDGFLAGSNDEFALCYYDEGDLGFIHPAGREFTVYDRFHCSLMASTWPNRYYKLVRAVGRQARQHAAGRHARQPVGDVFDRAIARGRTARYYNSDLPVLGGLGPARRAVDAARGGLLRRLRGRHAAEHRLRGPAVPRRRRRRRRSPPTSTRSATCGSARRSCPTSCTRSWSRRNWERGALFIVYDEWGGFFDHVRPPTVPDARRSSNIDQDFGLMGFRIPAVGRLALRAAAARSATSCAGSSRSSS